jgi:hypothetical protein
MNYVDVFVDPILRLAKANQTNTFRKMSQNELSLILRLLQQLVERPFVNGNPIAGTSEHRQIAIETIIRLLGK